MQASAPARSLTPARSLAPATPVPATPVPATPVPAMAWDRLRAMCQADLLTPSSAAPGRCRACQGPAGPGYARCFQCELHAQSAPGLLADAVAPVAYAAKGSPLARDLWLYKAGRPESGAAGSRLLLLLLAFLHDHGSRVWRLAGMARPSHACVVPSGRGRAGPHPLQALAAPYLALPWAGMRPRPGSDPWARSLDAGRVRAGPEAAGAEV